MGADQSAWLEIHVTVTGHLKTLRLKRLLGCSQPYAVGLLVSLWLWAIDYAQDGDLTRYADDLPTVLGDEDQKAPDLIEALVGAGYVDRDKDGRLTIHDWEDYAGRLLSKRRANAERAKKWREDRKAEEAKEPAERAPNAFGMRSERVTNEATRHDTTQHNLKEATPVERRLIAAARGVTGWVPNDQKDIELIRSLLQRYPSATIAKTIAALANRQAARKQYKDVRRALGNWMSRETPKEIEASEVVSPAAAYALAFFRDGLGWQSNLAPADEAEAERIRRDVMAGKITEADVMAGALG